MLFEADVNYLAVLLAAIAAQPLGFLWYGKVFREPWMKLRGYTSEDTDGSHNPGIYILAFLLGIVIAYVLARLVDMVGAYTICDSLKVAAFAWSGFTATTMGMGIIFSKTQSVKLWMIESGYQLVCFLVAGAIIGAFQ